MLSIATARILHDILSKNFPPAALTKTFSSRILFFVLVIFDLAKRECVRYFEASQTAVTDAQLAEFPTTAFSLYLRAYFATKAPVEN